MNPRKHVVLIPLNLGEASLFNRTIFPLSYRKSDSLSQINIYLDATLSEILKIANIGANPEQCEEIVATMKAQYDRFLIEKIELEKRPKTRNPIKAIANYRAALMFLAASKSLYIETRRRSDEVMRTIGRRLLSRGEGDTQSVHGAPSSDIPQRSEEVIRTINEGLQSFPADDIQSVDRDPPPGTNIKAIAVGLDRPLDDATRQQLLDAANTIVSHPAPCGDDQSISEGSSIFSDEYFLASESLSSLALRLMAEEPEEPEAPEEPEEIPNITDAPSPSSPTSINHYHNCTFFSSLNSNVNGATVNAGALGSSGAVIHTIIPPDRPPDSI